MPPCQQFAARSIIPWAVQIFIPFSSIDAIASIKRFLFQVSVRLFLTMCIVALRVGVGVESCAVMFPEEHFLFTSSYTFTVGWRLNFLPGLTAALTNKRLTALTTTWPHYNYVSLQSQDLRHVKVNSFIIIIIIIQPATLSEKNSTAEISASGIATSSLFAFPRLFQTRHFRRFGSAAIPYIVRSTIDFWATATVLDRQCIRLLSISAEIWRRR